MPRHLLHQFKNMSIGRAQRPVRHRVMCVLHLPHMSRHAHTVLIYHVVFATKRRAALIAEENLQTIMDSLATKANDLVVEIFAMNGYVDHMHILMRLPATRDLGKIVGQLKGYSSRMNPNLRWQIGYAAFTVSANSVRTVRKYIRDQERHHEAMDYRGEMSALKKNNLILYVTAADC